MDCPMGCQKASLMANRMGCQKEGLMASKMAPKMAPRTEDLMAAKKKLSTKDADLARALGLSLRLAHSLSASLPGAFLHLIFRITIFIGAPQMLDGSLGILTLLMDQLRWG